MYYINDENGTPKPEKIIEEFRVDGDRDFREQLIRPHVEALYAMTEQQEFQMHNRDLKYLE